MTPAVAAALPGEPGGWVGWMVRWLRQVVRVRPAGESPLRIEARLSLGPKKSLVLVNCRGRQLLLAVSGDMVSPVFDVSAPRSPVARTRKSVQKGAAE